MTNQKLSRVWLITGSSTGFGRALTEAVLAQGDRVIATARNISKIQNLEHKYPQIAKAVRLDVTDQASIQMAVQIGLATFGRIDVLVNNAGYGLIGAVEEVSDQQIRNQFETNVFGLLNVTRAVIPILRKQGSGHILNMCSVGGRHPVPTMGLYDASKAAVEGLSESLASEVKPFGIKVTILEPGGFDTGFVDRSTVSAEPMPEYDFLREQIAKFAAGYVRGDAVAGVQAMLKVVELPDPPLRLALGPNALPTIIQKLTADIEEYKRFEHIWQSSTANAVHNSSLSHSS
ncbi:MULTISPECIES: SDR family NAD(P)-dependent oxidoreductase [unclassified Leptolyngbya]|uniref:SDR family NAD(P)-dependent oxidoreductase n=1 Tax=unclassified Leptolyngbya TaxID=2650499 RepID=UPI0016868E4F|nr:MULTISPECIES: SDR family NAD(P)-dependent oxidoreductase [unclassified Leptolyngbya]MBD1914073.1 SDR family NAD(P)-dependent oxidoreductase [Leptolyngbya sp. FACHB-8]MBD2152993.1 SDR family NAD(P)-dependent oxidoreductase [Leptolyngbya sp. FACHB-16]